MTATTAALIATEIARVFRSTTGNEARLLGLYNDCLNSRRHSSQVGRLYLRHALRNERIVIAEFPHGEIINATQAALNALARERERLERPGNKRRFAAAPSYSSKRVIARLDQPNTRRRNAKRR